MEIIARVDDVLIEFGKKATKALIRSRLLREGLGPRVDREEFDLINSDGVEIDPRIWPGDVDIGAKIEFIPWEDPNAVEGQAAIQGEAAQHEREQALIQREEALNQREQALNHQGQALDQREQTLDQREQTLDQREQAQNERQQAQSQRDQAQVQRDQAQVQRDHEQNQRQQAQYQRQQVDNQRDQAQLQRQQVQDQREQGQNQREEAQNEAEQQLRRRRTSNGGNCQHPGCGGRRGECLRFFACRRRLSDCGIP